MGSTSDFFSNIPVIGGFFESDEEKNLKKQYADMQAKYQAYRPVAQQARMGGLQNVLDPRMLGPVNAQLAKLYGQGAQIDPTPLLRDPLAAAQLAQFNQQAPQRAADAAFKQQAAQALGQVRHPFGRGPSGPMMAPPGGFFAGVKGY